MSGSAQLISSAQFEELLPLAVQWAEQQEAYVLAHGIPLSPSQLSDAKAVGVLHPERVRLMSVPAIPMPEHPLLQAAGAATNLISPSTAGLSLRYGIFIRSDCFDDRFLVAHELVHTVQFERMGSIEAFLRQYLHECITIGYPKAPMEQEAVLTAESLRFAASRS